MSIIKIRIKTKKGLLFGAIFMYILTLFFISVVPVSLFCLIQAIILTVRYNAVRSIPTENDFYKSSIQKIKSSDYHIKTEGLVLMLSLYLNTKEKKYFNYYSKSLKAMILELRKKFETCDKSEHEEGMKILYEMQKQGLPVEELIHTWQYEFQFKTCTERLKSNNLEEIELAIKQLGVLADLGNIKAIKLLNLITTEGLDNLQI